MVTREQAIAAGETWGRTEFHCGQCKQTIGPRGGIKEKHEVWRSNGKCKTWKTRPLEFSLPIKYGFNGPYAYLDQNNAADFHLACDCQPLVIDQREEVSQ